MATNPTNMTPVEIDTILADNYEQQMRLQLDIAGTNRAIDSIMGRQSGYRNRPELMERLDKETARLADLRTQLRDVAAAAAPFHLEHIRRPWNRYFLVKNDNGHVHRGMNCHTCFADTQYGWLVELADCDEDAMIEEWGERACTVCFPTAPSNPLYNRPARIDREAQEARAAEKATKTAAKAEKAIWDVDGSELRVEGDTFRTKVAARNELSRQVQNGVWYGPKVDAIRQLAAALDAAGVEWVPVMSRAFKKAVKEAVPDPTNPYRLTEAQIAETQAEIAANIEATREVLEDLLNGEVVG